MKTFEEILIEVKRDNPQLRSHSALKMAIEKYANHKAELAHDMACKAQLQLISDTFRENAHKGDKQSDIDVFEAIADTIKKHPQPENPYKNERHN